MMVLVPLYYGGGSIILSYLQFLKNQEYPFSLNDSIPSIICMGISIFGFFNPFGIINRIAFGIVSAITGNDTLGKK
jgi:hypothetical protein